MPASEPSQRERRRLRVQHVPTGRRRPWAENPRIMPESEMESLKRSLAHWGLVQLIVVRRADNTVSTIIAAERAGRTCLAAEPEPRYSDMAVARWEALTGAPATRESGS